MKAASIDGPLGLLAACPVFDIEILYHAYIMNLFWGQMNCILVACLLATSHATRKPPLSQRSTCRGRGHILAASRSRIACYFCQMVG